MMAIASPSIGVIRAQIRAIRDKAPQAKFFGIFTPGRWTGPSSDGAGPDEIAVYQCDSPLQMRLAMQEAPESASATVLVTPLDQSKVSDDILVRLAMRKLHPINSWEIVRSLFKARQLDHESRVMPSLLIHCWSTRTLTQSHLWRVGSWMLKQSGEFCCLTGLAFQALIRMWWKSCAAQPNPIWSPGGEFLS